MHKTVRDALARSVLTKTEHNTGTGVILAPDMILTVFHTLETDSPLFINGVKVKASSMYVDQERDLILISMPTEPITPAEFAESFEKDDPIFYVGNPVGHVGAIARGRIVNILEGTIYTDFHGGPGASGAGVYTEDGKFLGILEGLQVLEKFGTIFSMCIGPETIIKFLAEKSR